jgi:PAS domain S-box-containing protein
VGCNIDVTQMRQTEEALRTQSRMTRAITENATLGLFMMDANQRCTFMNPAAERITGLSFAQVQALNKPLHDIIHHTRPDGSHFPISECPIDRALPTKAQEQGEDIFVRPDGSFYPVAFTASPLVENNVPVGTVIEVRDITERRRNEAALLRSEARYRLATRATNDVIWDWDFTTGELLWNEGVEATFGYPHPSVPPSIDWWFEHIHPEDRERVHKGIDSVITAGGKHWRDEYRFLRSDGSFALVTDRGYIEHDARGRPVRMVGAMQDVTERHLTEHHLREQGETLRILNQLGSVLAAELDMEKLVQAVTDAATRLTGAEFGAFFYNVIDARGEILTLYTLSGVPREAFSRFPMPRNTAVFHPTFTGQGVVRVDDITRDPRYGKNPPYNGMPQGHLPVVSYLATPVISRMGKVVGGLFFGHHRRGVFTERAEQLVVGLAAQAAVAMDNAQLFQQAQRLIKALERSNAELDQFAYVASHDLKAPLRGIANLSQWIEEDLAEAMTPETREQMNLLRGRVHRLEGLIDGILQYSRAGRVRTKPEPVDVGRLLKEVLELLSPPPGARVELAPELPTLHTERVPLQQVFLNLLGNALKHSQREDPHVSVSVRATGDGYEFSVRDNGPGIAPEYHERIWGIFQTLERRDKVEGTGIGLSVVKKIVESRGGRAWVESTPGAGATFRFFWPTTARGE